LKLSVASRRRGVPASTLRDRKNLERQNPKTAHFHQCLLSPTQEDTLVKWALFQDDMGIPLRQELLLGKAQAILHITSPSIKIGRHWIERFIKRHKELQMRYSQRIDRQKAATQNPKILEKHFNIFKKALKDYKITEGNI
jgi:hypothetical protein